MLMLFQEKEVQNCIYQTILTYTVSTVNHSQQSVIHSSPSRLEVHEVLECNFTLFPAFVASGSPLGLYGDTDREIFSEIFGFWECFRMSDTS